MRRMLIVFGPKNAVTTGMFVDGVLENVLSSLPSAPAARSTEDSPAHAWVVIPGEDVVQHLIDIPTANEKKALDAVPYLLEDSVAADLDELHFATGTSASGQRFAGVMSRTAMQAYLDQLGAQNLIADVITPDYLVAGEPSDATVTLNGSRAIVTLPDDRGLTLEISLFSQVLPPVMRQADVSRVQLIASSGAARSVAAMLPGINATVAAPPSTRQWLQAIHDRLARRVALNLRQGSFAVRRQWTFNLQPLKRAAVLASAFVVLLIAQLVVSGVRDNAEATRALAAADAAARSVLPAGARLVNARAQTQSLAASLTAGSAESFLALSETLAGSLKAIDGASVQSIQFDESRQALSVGVMVPSYDAMAALRAHLGSGGVAVDDGGARQSGNVVVGDLVMRRP